mgnify:CR=1 FL=1
MKKEIKRTTYRKVNEKSWINGDTMLAPFTAWILKLIEYRDGTFDVYNQDGDWLILEDCGGDYCTENGWNYSFLDLFNEPLTILKKL